MQFNWRGERFIFVDPIVFIWKVRVMRDADDHERNWRDLFDRQRATLEEAAYMVLFRPEEPKEILHFALDQLKNRPYQEVFGPASAIREVIKAAIARNQNFVDQDFEHQASVALPQWHSGPLPLEALPWAERAVYFLREVLQYALRDTALLLSISDREVCLLARAAKRRMGRLEDSPKHEFCQHTPVAASIRVRHSIAFAAYE